MSPEEKLFEEYEYLVPITLHKKYKSPTAYAKSKGLEYDDLMQYGRYGLWEAIKTFDESRNGSLRNHCIRCIRWSLGKSIPREELNPHLYKYNGTTKRNPKDRSITVLSMHHKPFGDEDETTFYDILAADNINHFGTVDMTNEIFYSNEYNRLINKLNEKDKKLFMFKLNGLNSQEIADIYGVKRQGVHVKLQRIQKRLRSLMEGATV